MSSYQIELNTQDFRFDTSYPIFLEAKGVSKADFKSTIQWCNRKLHPYRVQEYADQKISMLMICTIMTQLVLFAVGVAAYFILLQLKIQIPKAFHYSIIISPVVILLSPFLVRCIGDCIRICFLPNCRHVWTDIYEFLEMENRRFYFAKGVQFLLKSNRNGRVIEVLVTERPYKNMYPKMMNAPSTSENQTDQTPLLHQGTHYYQ